MKRNFAGSVFIFILAASMLLGACQPGPVPNGPTPVGGIGFNLDEDEPDLTVKPGDNPEGCPLGSTRLTSQHIKTVSSIVFEDAPDLPQDVQRLRIVIASGTYTFRSHPQLGPNCTDAGPDSPVITVDFTADYLAEVDHSIQPVCVHRSRADYSRFDVRNAPSALDDFILEKARDSILEALDKQTANTLNPFYFNNAARDQNAAVRCEWSVLQ